jgi:FlaA1/EpsC-like NDP-sugar epimerase
MAHDLAMIPIAWLGSYWFRYNLESVPVGMWSSALATLPVVLLVQGASFWYFGLYRGIWRFASIPDFIRILKAVSVGVIASAAIIFLWTRLEGVPRSVFVLDAVFLILILGGSRLLYRWHKDRHIYMLRDGKRALIVGAGRAGEMLARDMLRNPESPYQPVAFVDDDAGKRGMDMHGLRVYGPCENIPELARQLEADLVLIALPSADSRALRRIVEICEQANLPFRALPPLQDLVSGQVSVKQLRDVQIEDLLGREKVTLDWDAIHRGMTGHAVMVTGGGGSIGSELCRQVARLGPSRLIVVDSSEYNLYRIDLELRRDFPQLNFVAGLGDVTDADAIGRLMRGYRPSVVFHAAAYKHVPLLEHQAPAAVANNIFGTRVVAEQAVAQGCETFVLISTDKAVNPANIMGTSKRVAEIVCQDLDRRSKTRFVTVRFGNVLGSAGSVVPLFQEQIARGGPVTVTHPDITRYFMTIPEACQLILQASVIGEGGEIFVLDMGEPVKIAYLAEQLIRLSGRKPGEDIEIVYTGLRPGEKLYEELFHDAEHLGDTRHPKIHLARSRSVTSEVVARALADLRSAIDVEDERTILSVLQELVPEYSRSTDTQHSSMAAMTRPAQGTGYNKRDT